MVSTRKTATVDAPSTAVPIVKKRKGIKIAKAKRPVKVTKKPEKADEDIGAEEDYGLDGEKDAYGYSDFPSNTPPEQSRLVAKENSRAHSRGSGDSQVVIEGLKRELDQMRKLLADHGIKGVEKIGLKDVHAEDVGETSVRKNHVDHRVIAETERGDRPLIQWSSYKNFRDCQPPTFKGGEEPLGCMRWLREMEQVFDSGMFSDHQRVVFASRMLKDEAADWWDAKFQSMTPEVRTTLVWTDFASRVRDRFCAASAVSRASRDFLDLTMGSMSVAKFNSLFLEKLQFARKYCPDEHSTVERYVEAIRPEFRVTVRHKNTLEEAMEEARVLERDMKDLEKLMGTVSGERKFDKSSSSSKKKKINRDEQGKREGRGEAKWCDACRNRHRGPCSTDTVRCRNCGKTGHRHSSCKNDSICYNCKETGHLSRDCPKKKAD